MLDSASSRMSPRALCMRSLLVVGGSGGLQRLLTSPPRMPASCAGLQGPVEESWYRRKGRARLHLVEKRRGFDALVTTCFSPG